MKDLMLQKNQSSIQVLFGTSSVSIDKDYFVAHYQEFLVRTLANGRPSEDTKAMYFSHINTFLAWLAELSSMNALDCDERHIMAYREYLYHKELKTQTIAAKLTAVNRFYQCALRMELIKDNPAKFVRPAQDPDSGMPAVKYLAANQLDKLLRLVEIKDECGNLIEENYRDRLIMLLMGIEGLRTVEINRMSVHDINWDLRTIFIHGKGHNDYIYPRDDILQIIRKYLDAKKGPIPKDKHGIPVFTVVSNNNQFARLSRQSIRKAVNMWLSKANIRNDENDQNFSCHLLRHTCGTLLYAETKDLQVVKETLRHRDLKMASKYAHLQKRLLNRYTNAIPIKIDN